MHTIPIEGMVLILGVDRLMAEARAVTNLIGNGVATIVLSRWENEFDPEKAKEMLNPGCPIPTAPSSAPEAAVEALDKG